MSNCYTQQFGEHGAGDVWVGLVASARRSLLACRRVAGVGPDGPRPNVAGGVRAPRGGRLPRSGGVEPPPTLRRGLGPLLRRLSKLLDDLSKLLDA